MHLKRNKVPNEWPIKRKGTTYMVRPSSGIEGGVPVLVALRDMLKVVNNRKESKKAIYEKKILLNTKVPRDEKITIRPFEIITFVPSKENYMLKISKNKKYSFEKINKSGEKISKIVDKKILRGKKVQINFNDGRNLISDIKSNIGDSVLIDLKNKKAIKVLPMKKNAKVIVLSGKHRGEEGKISNLDFEKNVVEIMSDTRKINVLIKQIMVIE